MTADPKQPRFSLSIVGVSLPARRTTGAIASFGENIGLARWIDPLNESGIQVGVTGAVFAQFDLAVPSTDLVNADYTIGLPVTLRKKSWSARLRPYHQSSHLGDEYLLNNRTDRINLSYETMECLVSWEKGAWRVAGGGEYMFHKQPKDLNPGLLEANVEFRPKPTFEAGNLGTFGWIVAVNMKSWQEDRWRPAWSFKGGFEIGGTCGQDALRRTWSILLEYYDGFAPYGQFFAEQVRYWGLGVQFFL